MELEIFEHSPKGKITIVEDTELTETIEHKNTHVVIDMNKQPLKMDTSWMVKEVPYSEPSEEEKKLLEGTKTAKELIEEEQKEEKKELTYEEKLEQYRRDYITKVKVVALYKCRFSPVSNPSFFSQIDKQRIMDKMSKIIKNYNDDELTDEFNTIINNTLLDSKTKYEHLPVMRK